MLLFAVLNVSAQSNPEWKMIHPGVWKAVIGKPDAMTLLSVADASSEFAGNVKIAQQKFPITPRGDQHVSLLITRPICVFHWKKENSSMALGSILKMLINEEKFSICMLIITMGKTMVEHMRQFPSMFPPMDMVC